MLNWLENAVFYQVYPISFFDSNGDGKGDLQGIIQKADYLQDLGVTCVWLNPIYKSPFKDAGYDIADYMQIDKRFGTMEDLQAVIDTFHARGIRVILDLVIGHTSNKHPWFKKSATAKPNKYWDYYVWTENLFQDHPGLIRGLHDRDGGYLPNYYASQPALNYGFENPDPEKPWQMHYTDERLRPLREELLQVMRHYLDMGADGFRVDMAGHMIKGGSTFEESKLFDHSDEGLNGIKWFWNQILPVLRAEYKDAVFVAEWCLPQIAIAKCGFDVDILAHDNVAFNDLLRNEPGENLVPYYERGDDYFSPNGKGTMKNFVEYTAYLYDQMGNKGMFTTATGSHDEIRMSIHKDEAMIRCIWAFLLTYKNVPFVYYGDEIGMEHNFELSKDGGGIRTGARTPMQWTKGRNRGFTTSRSPYLPTSNKKGQSVEEQLADPNSILNCAKELIALRKTCPALFISAKQTFLETGYPAVYTREGGGQKITVLLNPSNETYTREVKHSKVLKAQNTEIDGATVTLKPQSFAILEN